MWPWSLGVREESFLAHLAVSRVLLEMAPFGGWSAGRPAQTRGRKRRRRSSSRGCGSACGRLGCCPLEGLAADVALIRASVAVRDQVALVEVLCSEKFRATLRTGKTSALRDARLV